eukprot:NODE_1020_length_2080_cov_0.264008.p1 type:complete len:113 gc:universal NODE_1020_length_2080_cov_0.264008:813-1151(+)
MGNIFSANPDEDMVEKYDPNESNMVAFDIFKNLDYSDRIKIKKYLNLSEDEVKLFIAICTTRLPEHPEHISADSFGIVLFEPHVVYEYVDTIRMKKCPDKPIKIWLKKNKYF